MTIFRVTLSRSRAILAAIAATLIVTLGWSNVASAHTDFDSSTPSDQETVEGPFAIVSVDFTNPAVPAGSGFELLDPSGAIRTPSSIDPTDGTSFVLQFDPPLSAGTYGVRWKVQAGDAHPIDGTFVFDVTEPVPTSAPGSGTAATGGTTPASTVPAAAESDPSTTVAAVAAAAESDSTDSAVRATSLDEFIVSGSTADDSVPVGRTGRAVTFLGTIFGVGGLAALVWVIRGRRDELHAQLAWVRLAGIVIATGGLIELAALQASQSVGIEHLIDTKAGLAALLKIVGGILVWFGLHDRAGRVIAPAHSLSAAVATDLAPAVRKGPRVEHTSDEHRWTPSASAAIGLAGYAVILASFCFDGHTVTKGPWAVHSLLNLIHVGAAAVWGGGVFAMTSVVWLRRRRSEQVGLAQMVIRFSSLATVSLIAVIVAGLTMTAFILDTPGDLFSTTWGRVLTAKTLAVGVAAAMGGYNHIKLRPALVRSPDDPMLAAKLRTTLTIESIVFGLILILTAWLVASAT